MARIRQKTIQYPGIDNEYTFADEANLFDAEEPWVVGDYCIYAGDLYRCTTDHTGSWNSEHFTAVKTGDELKALNGSLNSTDHTIALVINGDINNTGSQISANTYIILKGNSTLPDGGYISGTDIANGQSLTNSNLLYIPNGLTNYLKYDRIAASSNTTLISAIQNKYGTGGQVWGILLFVSTGSLFSDLPNDAGGYGAGFAVMAGYYHTAYYQSSTGDFYMGIKNYAATSWTWTKIH